MNIRALVSLLKLAEKSGFDVDKIDKDFGKVLKTGDSKQIERAILDSLSPEELADVVARHNGTQDAIDKHLDIERKYRDEYKKAYGEDAAAAKKKAIPQQAIKGVTGLANNLASTNVQIASLLGQALQAMQPSAKSKEVYGSDIVSSAIPLAAAKMQISPRITHSVVSSIDKTANDVINERNLLDQRAEMMAYQQANPANQGFWLAWNGINSASNKQALQQAKQNAGEK